MPPSLGHMFNAQRNKDGAITDLELTTDWASFFHSLQQTAFAQSRSSTTAFRPSKVLDGRYIGMPYFDTSLGLPVFLKTASTAASTDVWVNGAGTPV